MYSSHGLQFCHPSWRDRCSERNSQPSSLDVAPVSIAESKELTPASAAAAAFFSSTLIRSASSSSCRLISAASSSFWRFASSYSSMLTRNTPYSKTKPFREIAIAALANPLENHFTTASRSRAASPASAFSHALLYHLVLRSFVCCSVLDARESIQQCLTRTIVPKTSENISQDMGSS